MKFTTQTAPPAPPPIASVTVVLTRDEAVTLSAKLAMVLAKGEFSGSIVFNKLHSGLREALGAA